MGDKVDEGFAGVKYCLCEMSRRTRGPRPRPSAGGVATLVFSANEGALQTQVLKLQASLV
ncbi:hypothetical protein PAXINDRAFT_173112 [Paxillus involutus ATCC 200175]|uniref:Uncharacterized protein n=1 Tax=Paxillus involutus ATCC 200175 TaxID=664439 RepID=A0A0C9SNJ8_PAXIN|nr:hypothetical protein PAXINDRAFT_173112 [Paxillus involutus ATCC 200175]